MSEVQPQRRAADRGVLCWIAHRFSQLWDFIDKRDIDKHVVASLVMYQTLVITQWSFEYAKYLTTQPGMEIAAVIVAIDAPWSILVGAVVKWYFNARTE